MSDVNETTTPADAPTKAPKPPVFDSREGDKAVALELGMRVKLIGDQDKDDTGKPKLGTITGIEYQRQRVVVRVDGQEKQIVRPAAKTFVVKTKAGKIERVERAVRAGRKAAAVEAPAPVEAPVEVPADETPVLETTTEEDAPSPV